MTPLDRIRAQLATVTCPAPLALRFDAEAAPGGVRIVALAEVPDSDDPAATCRPRFTVTIPEDASRGRVAMAVAEVYRAKAPLASGVLERVAEADLGAMGLATGAGVSAAGDWVVVRSYFSARMWLRPQGLPLAQAFMSTPCTVPLAMEIQGEAIAFAAEGLTYYTVSEGETPPLFRFDGP